MQDCLKALAFQEIDSRSREIEDAVEGTCQWLLGHDAYTRWASACQGLLWVKGKPGSGKSTLLRHALHNVNIGQREKSETLKLSYFFHNRGSDLQKTPLGLFRSLLHQLLKQIPKEMNDVSSFFERQCKTIGKEGEDWQWHPRELQSLFELSIQKALKAHQIWLFVDALDECGRDNAVELVAHFKSLMKKCLGAGMKRLHICFTCRHYPIVDMGTGFEIWVERENSSDISKYVQHSLSAFQVRNSNKIRELITTRADGVFLWAQLVVKRVLDLERDGAGWKEIEAGILSVPPQLDTLYQQLLQSAQPESLKLIQWLCFSTRPLALMEIGAALSIDATTAYRSLQECHGAGNGESDLRGLERRIQSLSCGLVQVTRDNTRGVQFIHQTVKDYFLEKGLSALVGTMNPAKTNMPLSTLEGEAHYRISRACMRYLSMHEVCTTIIEDPQYLTQVFPLVQYATTSWLPHALESNKRGISQDDILDYFSWPSGEVLGQWVRLHHILLPYPNKERPYKGMHMLHLAARYELLGLLKILLRKAKEDNVTIFTLRDHRGRTPLAYAAQNGHEAAVRMLLETNKSVALWAQITVRRLRNKRTRVDYRDKRGRTALLWAIEGGHEIIIRMLLEKGADPSLMDRGDRTPLFWAVWSKHEAIVRLLLEKGVAVDAPDYRNRTPLSWAAQTGREGIVRLLLSKGAQVDQAHTASAKTATHRTPLSFALQYKHEAAARALIEHGARVSYPDNTHHVLPLSWTALTGHDVMARLLVDKGAQVNCADRMGGRTPLSLAVQFGHVSLVRWLLEKGADPGVADRQGRTPLSWAARDTRQGHEAIVKMLLGRRVDVNAADKLGRTPLLWAARAGNDTMVLQLLDRGAKMNVVDRMNRTPLFWATLKEFEPTAKILLNRGALVDSTDKTNKTPLSVALRADNSEIALALIDKGAEYGVPDPDEYLLLWAAGSREKDTEWSHQNVAPGEWYDSDQDCEMIARRMLRKGAKVDYTDKVGRTPLSWASRIGNMAIVSMLIDKGADVNSVDKQGRTPLSWACRMGHKPIIHRLLNAGATVDAADKLGRTPLGWATEAGYTDIVQLLIKRGA